MSTAEELGLFTSLTTLWINGNKLNSTFPESVWQNLGNLSALNMKNNQVTGTIATEFGLLTKLTALQFSECGLEGTLPSELLQLTRLQYLVFRKAELRGTIPPFGKAFSDLKWLVLDENNYTGKSGLDA